MSNFVKFISDTYTGFTLSDIQEETSFDMGSVFYNEAKVLIFRLGNPHTSRVNYRLSVSGENWNINNGVQFSTDGGKTYEDTATVSGIYPNGVSDAIFCRYISEQGSPIDSGTFLIHGDIV